MILYPCWLVEKTEDFQELFIGKWCSIMKDNLFGWRWRGADVADIALTFQNIEQHK